MAYDITPKNIIQYILTKLKGVLSSVALSGSYNDLSDKPTIPDISAKVSKSGDTMTGKLTISDGGLLVSGRVYGGGDDEGIVITPLSNGYAGVCLGSPSGRRSVFYLNNGNGAFWRYNNGSVSYDILHPQKSGTIAVKSDIPSLDDVTAVKDYNNNTPTKFGYSTSGMAQSAATWLGAWDASVSGEYRLRAVKQADLKVAYASSAGSATTSSNSNWLNGSSDHGTSYASNDTHIMQLGYFTRSKGYNNSTILVTSAFWGNQHGSADIINMNQDSNGSNTQDLWRVRISDKSNRKFYFKISNDRIYLYAYVTGGNQYGRWNITELQGSSNTAHWVSEYLFNQSSSGLTEIGFSGQVGSADIATKAGTDGDDRAFPSSYASRLSIRPNGQLAFMYELYSPNGATLSSGNVNLSSSSRKFKENIAPLVEEEAKKILDVETVTFDYIEDYDNYTSRKGYKNIGCIAEDINEIIPELVTEDENGEIYGVNYLEMIPYLLKVVQMQQKQLDEQQKKIDALELLIKGVVE